VTLKARGARATTAEAMGTVQATPYHASRWAGGDGMNDRVRIEVIYPDGHPGRVHYINRADFLRCPERNPKPAHYRPDGSCLHFDSRGSQQVPNLVTCRALGCHRRRVRPGASHCDVHTVEWYAIEADQRELIQRGTAISIREWDDLRARRFAMNMSWPPRNLAGRGPGE
jgi:hypothetical protein